MAEQPYDRCAELDRFEDRTPLGRAEPHDSFIQDHGVDSYDLFLQDLAVSEMVFATVNRK